MRLDDLIKRLRDNGSPLCIEAAEEIQVLVANEGRNRPLSAPQVLGYMPSRNGGCGGYASSSSADGGGSGASSTTSSGSSSLDSFDIIEGKSTAASTR